jgi:hypothetical protein
MPPPLVGKVNSIKAGPVSEPWRRIRADHFPRIFLALRALRPECDGCRADFGLRPDTGGLVLIMGSLAWARRREVSGRPLISSISGARRRACASASHVSHDASDVLIARHPIYTAPWSRPSQMGARPRRSIVQFVENSPQTPFPRASITYPDGPITHFRHFRAHGPWGPGPRWSNRNLRG